MARNSSDFEKLKSPNQPTTYTTEQLKELSKCARDPLYFMENYIYIQHPKRGKIRFEAYSFQRELIKTYWSSRNTIAMIPRQSGKTTTAAGYLLWYAIFNPDVTILIAAHKFKGASEIMNRIKYAYEELPNYIRPGVSEYNVQSIKFDNDSRILATTTTPDSGRGLAISLLYLDEFSFVKPRVAEEFWSAMAPTLATGGSCIITSTPASDEDMFAQLWLGANNMLDEDGNELTDGIGINGFKAFTAHYSEVPGRDDEWAKKEKAKIGVEKFLREYGCVTHNTILNLFDETTGTYLNLSIGDLYHSLQIGHK